MRHNIRTVDKAKLKLHCKFGILFYKHLVEVYCSVYIVSLKEKLPKSVQPMVPLSNLALFLPGEILIFPSSSV